MKVCSEPYRYTLPLCVGWFYQLFLSPLGNRSMRILILRSSFWQTREGSVRSTEPSLVCL